MINNILDTREQVFASNRWVTESTYGTQPRAFDGTFYFKPFLQTLSSRDEFYIIYINKFFAFYFCLDAIYIDFFKGYAFNKVVRNWVNNGLFLFGLVFCDVLIVYNILYFHLKPLERKR